MGILTQRFFRNPHRLILTYALLGVWTLVCLFPLYWVAVTSLKAEAEITGGPFYLPFLDFAPTLESWAYLLTDPNDNLLGRYFNSLVVALAATALALLLGAMAVYGVSRFTKGGQAILTAMLATRVLPPMVMALPLYMMAYYTDTLDTRFALIFTYAAINLPVVVWLLQPVFGPRATEQEEAAQLDGASRLAIFFSIFLPMVAGSLAAVGLFVFILCWNEYLFAAWLAGNNAMTLPPWLVGQMSMKEAQVGGEAEEWARFSAATVMMMAPLLIVAILTRANSWLGRLALFGNRHG